MSSPPSPAGDSGGEPTLAERLRGVRVGVRQDLEATRHLFRGKPAYVLRDPMTFQSHRLEPADYSVFVALNPSHTLGEIFGGLVERGVSSAEDEEAFYRFVFTLHRMNFLNLPISDEQLLYRRFLARRRARRKEKLMGFLFLRVPLVNPDAFLTRTIRYGRHIFSAWFFAAWVLLIAAAGFVLIRNYTELLQPVQGVLAARNIPIMWITLVGLKIFHEFGHAYACKRYGGYVPEMGAYFIVFTPCAYVDATACWGFSSRRERLIVCLGGMYVESIFAAIAVFVWAASPPGLVHDIAYNVLFLAGVVTVLFNINPLMRYDGYYVLSDLVEIPNLRQRSTNYVVGILKRVFLGIRGQPLAIDWRQRALLFFFGIAASLYRTVLVLAISAMIASKMFLVGLGVAGMYVGNTLIGLIRKLTKYLWYANETAPVRRRAIAVSVLLFAGVPTLIVAVPVRSSVQTAGVFTMSDETVVRAGVDGFVHSAETRFGQSVAPGDVLVELGSDALNESIATAKTEIQASGIRQGAYEVVNPALAMEEKEQGGVHRLDLDRYSEEQAKLLVKADRAGQVIQCLREQDIGRFIRAGEPVATVAAGTPQVRAILSEEDVADVQPVVGDRVFVRTSAVPSHVWTGVIHRVAPAGSRTIEAHSLTHVGGGDIVVNPMTGEARQPYFEVTVDLTDPDADTIPHGMTCQVRFGAGAASIGRIAMRRFLRFTDSLLQG